MVLEALFGGALLGLFSGALMSQMTTRMASKTLDVATEEAERVMAKLRGEEHGDPETKCVVRALHNHELEWRIKLARLVILEFKDDSSAAVRCCVEQLQTIVTEVEEILRDIRIELQEHRKRRFNEFLFSNVRPMLNVLREKLDSIDQKVMLLISVKGVSTKRLDKVPASAAAGALLADVDAIKSDSGPAEAK